MSYNLIFARNLTVLASLMVTPLADATTFYVSPSSGRDTNSGKSTTAPWKTLTKAFSATSGILPGDTIQLMPGKYLEEPTTLGADGTAAQPIVIDGSNKAAIIQMQPQITKAYYVLRNITFDGTGTGTPYTCGSPAVTRYTGQGAGIRITSSAAHHVVIENCDISNGYYGVKFGLVSSDALDGSGGPHHNVIQNCSFHNPWGDGVICFHGHDNTVSQCTFTKNDGWDAFRVWGKNNTVTQCTIRNWNVDPCGNHVDIAQTFRSANNEVSVNFVFERNLITDSSGQMWMTEANQAPPVPAMGNWIFRNNLVVRSRSQFSIGIPNCKFYNNVFYDSADKYAITFGTGVMTSNGYAKGDGSHGRVYNNIFCRVGLTEYSGFYSGASGARDLLADYNLFTDRDNTAKMGLRTTNAEGVAIEQHSINGGYTPYQIFVDPDHGNFQPKTTSPALKAGMDLSQVPLPAGFREDYVGEQRSVPWCRGAFQSSSVIMPPTNLQVVSQ